MVIGCAGVRKHHFIEALFETPNEDSVLALPDQTMDLLIKAQEEDDQEVKYQFWLRTLRNQRFDGPDKNIL